MLFYSKNARQHLSLSIEKKIVLRCTPLKIRKAITAINLILKRNIDCASFHLCVKLVPEWIDNFSLVSHEVK